MFSDDEPWFSPRPFWFARDELLIDFCRAEIDVLLHILAQNPNISKTFDAPEANLLNRRTCFELLAHREIAESAEETLLGRRTQLPPLTEAESNALRQTGSLVAGDAPAWVLEIDEVAKRLAFKIQEALPEPLQVGGFNENNASQVEKIRSAAKTLDSVEQLQALTRGVIDQQLQRLERRWAATKPIIVQPHLTQPDQSSATKAYSPNPFEGLRRKNDLSRYSQYIDALTEKQRVAFLLKFEYGLGLTQIASRMGINHKTAYEHIEAAKKNIEQARSAEKRKARRAKNTLEF